VIWGCLQGWTASTALMAATCMDVGSDVCNEVELASSLLPLATFTYMVLGNLHGTRR